MNNKKILISFLLVVLIALSIGSISAQDTTDIVAADDSIDEIAVDDSADIVAAEPITPKNTTVEAVQEAVNSADKTGDIVDLSGNPEYDFGSSTVVIANNNIIVDGKGTTTIKGTGAGQGLFQVTGKNVTIQGIHFIDTAVQNFTYGGSTAGWGVSVNGGNDGVIKDCNFTDFNSAVVVMGTTGYTIENNDFNGGYTTLIANDPTVNVEKGSKSLNIYKQSSKVTVRGNTFSGPILDAVSIAQGSGSNIVENNLFIGNAYSIYFGGSSTKGSVIRNNTFINCGEFKRDGQNWDKLPVISIQKASNDIAILDNTFKAVNNSILIAAEQGNEAHGFPSSLGNINVTGSIVTLYNESVDPSSVVLFHVLCRDGTSLNLFAPLLVENNNLPSGVREYVVWYTDWGQEYKDVIIPTNNTTDALQFAIDSAINHYDVVDLSYYDVFDLGNKTINVNNGFITIKGNGSTIIKGTGAGQGLFQVTGKNVTIQGIHFIDTAVQNFTYGGSTAGWGVSVNGGNDGVIKDCNFTDFQSAVVVMGTTGYTIENNDFNGGYSTLIANDPTVNVEKGSKSLNIYRQSSKIIVRGNTFSGPILDGVSIAQGSGSNIVENNLFVGNAYGIYFGGSSTKNSIIRNNTFIECGEFKRDGQNWTKLPVISIQKASNDIAILNNTFIALNDNILIAAEQGNEAHGFPSSLGNINVTGNTVKLNDSSVDPTTVVLFHILVREGELNVFAPINVTDNNVVKGVSQVDIWNAAWGDESSTDGGMVIPVATPKELANTTIVGNDLTITAGQSGTIKLTLTAGSTPLSSKEIHVSIDNVDQVFTTDANGSVTLPVTYANAGSYVVVSYFVGDDDNKFSITQNKITVNAKPAPAPAPAKVTKKATTLTAKKATLKVKKVKKIKVTLKSGGKAVAGKTVTIKVNKKTFKAKTNKKGVATIKVKVTKKGKFSATVKFAGDKTYKAVTKTVKYTVKK